MFTRIAIALATVAALSGAAHAADCSVKMKDYQAVKTNMTLAEANKAIGCEGTESTSMSIGSIEAVAYTWDGPTPGSAIIGSFQNDKLVFKMQMGLK